MKWDNCMPFWRTRTAVSHIRKVILCVWDSLYYMSLNIHLSIFSKMLYRHWKIPILASNASKLALNDKDKKTSTIPQQITAKTWVPIILWCNNYTLPLWQIGALTKWPTLCARHRPMHFCLWEINVSNTIPLTYMIQETDRIIIFLGGWYAYMNMNDGNILILLYVQTAIYLIKLIYTFRYQHTIVNLYLGYMWRRSRSIQALKAASSVPPCDKISLENTSAQVPNEL